MGSNETITFYEGSVGYALAKQIADLSTERDAVPETTAWADTEQGERQ